MKKFRRLSQAEMARLNSTDKTHGKMGHICSTLCGAAMLRVVDERVEVRSSDQYEVQ
jgi:hypothetical protein